MLVLARDLNQSVTMTLPNGDTITVTMLGLKHGHWKVGFDAPQSVKITRTELLTKDESQ